MSTNKFHTSVTYCKDALDVLEFMPVLSLSPIDAFLTRRST